jgi:hypothetical protein
MTEINNENKRIKNETVQMQNKFENDIGNLYIEINNLR